LSTIWVRYSLAGNRRSPSSSARRPASHPGGPWQRRGFHPVARETSTRLVGGRHGRCPAAGIPSRRAAHSPGCPPRTPWPTENPSLELKYRKREFDNSGEKPSRPRESHRALRRVLPRSVAPGDAGSALDNSITHSILLSLVIWARAGR